MVYFIILMLCAADVPTDELRLDVMRVRALINLHIILRAPYVCK